MKTRPTSQHVCRDEPLKRFDLERDGGGGGDQQEDGGDGVHGVAILRHSAVVGRGLASPASRCSYIDPAWCRIASRSEAKQVRLDLTSENFTLINHSGPLCIFENLIHCVVKIKIVLNL